jgi:hypothetical protein
VASALNLFRNGAVGFIGWLDFCTWFVNETIIKRAVAVAGLTSANRTALDVTAEHVDLSFCGAAVVAGLAAICAPVFLFLSITDATINLTANTKSRGYVFFCHTAVNLTRIRPKIPCCKRKTQSLGLNPLDHFALKSSSTNGWAS